MRNRSVGKVRIDDLYNLVIVIGEFLKLEIKIVQPGDELRLRRITFDNDELLAKDSFDNKTAAVMLQSGLTKHLLKADMLFRRELKIISMDFGVCLDRATNLLF